MSSMLNADGVANGGGVMEDFAMCPLVSGFVFVALSDFGSQLNHQGGRSFDPVCTAMGG